MDLKTDALIFDGVSNSEGQDQLTALVPGNLERHAFARLAYDRFFKQEVW
jgi:hypothetical protein